MPILVSIAFQFLIGRVKINRTITIILITRIISIPYR